MLRFSTDNLRKVFADEDKYKNFKKLTYDLNHGNDIYEYDEDGERFLRKKLTMQLEKFLWRFVTSQKKI